MPSIVGLHTRGDGARKSTLVRFGNILNRKRFVFILRLHCIPHTRFLHVGITGSYTQLGLLCCCCVCFFLCLPFQRRRSTVVPNADECATAILNALEELDEELFDKVFEALAQRIAEFVPFGE